MVRTRINELSGLVDTLIVQLYRTRDLSGFRARSEELKADIEAFKSGLDKTDVLYEFNRQDLSNLSGKLFSAEKKYVDINKVYVTSTLDNVSGINCQPIYQISHQWLMDEIARNTTPGDFKNSNVKDSDRPDFTSKPNYVEGSIGSMPNLRYLPTISVSEGEEIVNEGDLWPISYLDAVAQEKPFGFFEYTLYTGDEKSRASYIQLHVPGSHNVIIIVNTNTQKVIVSSDLETTIEGVRLWRYFNPGEFLPIHPEQIRRAFNYSNLSGNNDEG